MTDITAHHAVASTLGEQVASWEARVKDARRKGDPCQTTAIAAAAADAIEHQVKVLANPTQDETRALKAVQRFTYNASADAWPGWQQVEDGSLDRPTLVAAKRLAIHSAELVDTLQLGAVHQGTGAWLVAAFDLALGRLEDALAGFSISTQRYRAANAPGLVLLAQGYSAIAKGLLNQHSREAITKDLGAIFAQISSGGYEDGTEWIQQLETALGVFSLHVD
ncbi:uncharacterized protein Triagg1_9664 [Trichoderma aggressivum f. europaeum]|uniref:Uncharacterized protein n=1 Tax=Trichoderma aggressivum f. europaeum TaxID=173218 RepID=A0AAE1I681_9HYPO|nr:hypothetical protein Triagg1_9664 [Trichoderma aggressivum f. europaeum]